MYTEKDWEEFRDTGMLWYVNTFLMLFGWALLYTHDEEGYVYVTPVRTSYRGFSPEINADGYTAVTEFMRDHVDELFKDVSE